MRFLKLPPYHSQITGQFNVAFQNNVSYIILKSNDFHDCSQSWSDFLWKQMDIYTIYVWKCHRASAISQDTQCLGNELAMYHDCYWTLLEAAAICRNSFEIYVKPHLCHKTTLSTGTGMLNMFKWISLRKPCNDPSFASMK